MEAFFRDLGQTLDLKKLRQGIALALQKMGMHETVEIYARIVCPKCRKDNDFIEMEYIAESQRIGKLQCAYCGETVKQF